MSASETTPAQAVTFEGRSVNCADLFLGFATVGLLGFGGVMPWAHRMLVEKRRWLTETEFVNMLSLCQFLPGGNAMNMSVCVGSRFAGLPGALCGFLGLVAPPVAIVIGLAILYAAYGQIDLVEAAFRGISSAAAGLIVGLGLKLVLPLWHNPRAIATAALVIVAVLIQVPLALILIVGIPLSIAVTRALAR